MKLVCQYMYSLNLVALLLLSVFTICDWYISIVPNQMHPSWLMRPNQSQPHS